MDALKKITRMQTGIAALALGLMGFPAMAAPDDFINQSNLEYQYETFEIKDVPPETRRKTESTIKKSKKVDP